MMSTFTCDMSPAYDYSSVPKKQPKPQDATHTTVSVYLAAGFATIFLKVFVILAHFTTNQQPSPTSSKTNPPSEEKTTSQFCSPFHSAKE